MSSQGKRERITTRLCRGKYQGIIGVIVAFGYAIGPVIGGALSENVTWRVCLRRPWRVTTTNVL
jgi:MFS family permease